MKPVLLLCSISNHAIQQQELFQQLPEHRWKKIQGMKHQQDKLRCLCSWKLLEYGVQSYFGLDCSGLQWATDQHGKPYFQDAPQVQFNISHSGDWVGVALHTQPIGFDLQQIQLEKARVAKRVMAPQEWEQYVSGNHPVEFFFTLWALKESYCKYTGDGISLGFSQFICYEDGEEIVTDRSGCRFYSYCGLPGYRIAICCESVQKPDIFTVDLKNLERTGENG